MAEHADLRGDLEAVLHLVEALQDLRQARNGVVDRVEPQQRVSAAVGQAFEQGRRDALHVIGGVVGLQSRGQAAALSDRGVARRFDAHFVRAVDQIQVRHELADARDGLGGERLAEGLEVRFAHAIIQDVLAQLRHGHVLDPLVHRFVQAVLVDAGHLVVLVGNDRVLAQILDQQIRQHVLGGYAFQSGLRRDPGQHVAGFQFARLR